MSESVDIYQLVVEGADKSFSCSGDKTVLNALTDGGIFLEANCGGRGVCGKCKIQVLFGKVTGHCNSLKPLQPNIFLACQIRPVENLFVRLRTAEVSTKGNLAENLAVDDHPLIEKRVLTLDYRLMGDRSFQREMLDSLLPAVTHATDDGFLSHQLAEAVKSEPAQITVVLFNDELISIEAGDTSESLFGLAFDIGTTTVVGMLLNLSAQKVIAVCAETNPQVAFGADVISRINATKEPGNLEAQASAIRQCLNQIIHELCESTKVSPHEIYASSIAGNSTMEYLLMEISPLSLIHKPCADTFQYIEPFAPREIGLNINCNGKVVLLPNITSFIGGDTTAAILAADQDISLAQYLIVDLGTNGEMAIGNREKIFVCSTSAGSAFEGAHIRDGMRASAAAITDVAIDDEVRIKTIGGSKPLGICGVGLVKAIAELLKQRIITPSGSFNRDFAGLPFSLKRRFIHSNDQWEFVLVDAADTATGSDISITQDDVRKIQLAKSAICSGIQILLDRVKPVAGMQVLLAGAFGNYIDIESALTIGMFPGFNREQVNSIGNATGIGTVYTLLSREKLARSISIPHKIEYVELASRPDFQQKFLKNLSFPKVM